MSACISSRASCQPSPLSLATYACMNGNHSAPWFADAWFKGVRNFDLPTAYEGVRKRSLEVTMLPWRLNPKGPLDEFYAVHGYMPALHPGEKETDPLVHPFEKRQPVPVTLENSFDDWNIAHLAHVLKKPEDESSSFSAPQTIKISFGRTRGSCGLRMQTGSGSNRLIPSSMVAWADAITTMRTTATPILGT